ncbi:MAG: class I SAM-dependent methyltransferase [Lentisphaerae bacterium]|nr:class I SAM-dependent methyltransferase [Lentisphaerota bacterium]
MQLFLSKLKIISEFFDLTNRFHPLEGFLFPVEGYTLWFFASEGPGQGEIVEIGSYLGKSTCWIADGSKKAGREKVTAVDHFQGAPGLPESEAMQRDGSLLPQFLLNIKNAGLDDYIQPIPKSSEEAVKDWTKPIRMLFIDGNHSYEHCAQDFTLWSPFVVQSGIVAFHDVSAGYRGVDRVYKEMIVGSTNYRELITVNSLKIAQKVKA